MTCLQTKEWRDSQLFWYFTKSIGTERIIKDKSKENFLRLKQIPGIQMNGLIMFPAKSTGKKNPCQETY